MNNCTIQNYPITESSSPVFEKKKKNAVPPTLSPSAKINVAERSNGYIGRFFNKIHEMFNIGLSKKSLIQDIKTEDKTVLDKKINRFYDQNKNETEIATDLITALSSVGVYKIGKRALVFSRAYTDKIKYEKKILLACAGISALAGMVTKPFLKGINSIGTPKEERKQERTVMKDIATGFVDGAVAPVGYAYKSGIAAAAGINSLSRFVFNKHADKENAVSNHFADGWLVKIPALAIAGFSMFKFHKRINGVEKGIIKAKENIKNIKPFDAKLPLTELVDLAKSNIKDEVTKNELIDAAHRGFFSKAYHFLTKPLRKYIPQKAKLFEFIPKPMFRTLVNSPKLIYEREMMGIMRELEQYNIFYPKMIQSMPSNIEALVNLAGDSNKLSGIFEKAGKKSGKWYERLIKNRAEYVMKKGIKGINDFLNNYKSKCPASRNVKEAQKFISQTYGDRFKILGKEPLGVGTIAETFLAKDRKTGKEVVIKVVKKWASAEKLNSDKEKMLKALERVKNTMSKDDYNYQVKLVNELYSAWSKELDLKLEANAAEILGKHAVNYNTVAPIAVKNNIFVMEKAKGVQFDQFTKWLEKNKKTLTKDEAANLLRQYFQVFFEQLLSVPQKGEKILHADPHAGNIFIDISNKKKPFTFIDTGNVMRFTPEEAIKNVTSHLDYLIGNSKNIAKRLMKDAILPDGMTEKQAVDMLAKHLDETFFSGKNSLIGIKSDPFSAVNNESIDFMKKNRIILNSRNTNLVKAEITYLMNLVSIANISKSIDKNSVIDKKAQEEGMKLMFQQILKSISNGVVNNPLVTIKETRNRINYIDNNPEQFFTTLFSYIPPKV